MAGRLIRQLIMIGILGSFTSCAILTQKQSRVKIPAENFSKKLPVDTSKTEHITFQDGPQIEAILDSVVEEAKKTGNDALVFLSGDFFLKAQDASLRGDVQTAEVLFRYLIKMNPNEIYLQQRHALELIRLGNLKDALSILEEVYKSNPEEDMGLILGGIYTSLEMKVEAQKLYKKILLENPQNEEACIFLSKSYALDERYKTANNLLIKCQNKNPKKAIFAYFRGKIAMQRGYKKIAKNLFKLAMKREPDFFQAVLALGLIFEEEKNFNKAKKIYQEYLRENSNENFSILSRLVHVYFIMNDQLSQKSKPDFEEMVPYVEKLSSLDPSDLNLKVRLGILYAETNQYEEAIGVFKEILVAVPDSDKVNFYLGSLFQVTEDLDSAIESFQKIGPTSPLFVDSSIQIAKILNLQAQIQKARNNMSGQKRFVNFVSRVKGSSKELHIELAVELARYFESQQEVQNAIKAMEEVTEYKGFVDDHIFFLAALYDKEKDYVNAYKMIQRILTKNPDNAHALNFLGYSLLERDKDLDKAFEYISKAVKLKPQDGFIRDSLGWYYYKVGKLKKALIEIKKAWDLVKTDVVITKHLAIIHRDLKNLEEAKKYYFEALKQCKSNSERQDVINDLSGLEGVRLPANKSNPEKVMQPDF